jgi:hypothetical protein
MRNRVTRHSSNVVRWTFQYGHDLLTCGVTRHAADHYEVTLVPNGLAEIVERVGSLAAALRRHAEIAGHLRDHGWTLTAYAGARVAAQPEYRSAA